MCVLQERDFTLAVPPNCNHWSGDRIVDHIFSHPIIREGEIDTARSLSYTVMFCMACVCDFYTSLFRETTTHMVELNRISRAFAKPKPVCGYINAMSHSRRLLNKKNKCFSTPSLATLFSILNFSETLQSVTQTKKQRNTLRSAVVVGARVIVPPFVFTNRNESARAPRDYYCQVEKSRDVCYSRLGYIRRVFGQSIHTAHI